MELYELNNELKKVCTNQQIKLLLLNPKCYKLKGTFHGHTVKDIIITDGYAEYTYRNSKIKGRCRTENLHLYLMFRPNQKEHK